MFKELFFQPRFGTGRWLFKNKNMRKTSIIEEKERLTTCPTSLSGVSLRTKPGVYPSISSKMVDLLYWRARDYAQYYFAIKDLREKLSPLKEEIVRVVKENPDVQGICAEKDNFDLLVIPRRIIEWDRELLKKSLGVAYPGAVTDKELITRILIPERLKAEMLKDVISEALVKAGISEKDLPRLVEPEIVIDVDEKRLNELLKHPRGFRLKPGTKKEETIWAIKVERLKK